LFFSIRPPDLSLSAFKCSSSPVFFLSSDPSFLFLLENFAKKPELLISKVSDHLAYLLATPIRLNARTRRTVRRTFHFSPTLALTIELVHVRFLQNPVASPRACLQRLTFYPVPSPPFPTVSVLCEKQRCLPAFLRLRLRVFLLTPRPICRPGIFPKPLFLPGIDSDGVWRAIVQASLLPTCRFTPFICFFRFFRPSPEEAGCVEAFASLSSPLLLFPIGSVVQWQLQQAFVRVHSAVRLNPPQGCSPFRFLFY